jgi:signal transduction histidine kinase
MNELNYQLLDKKIFRSLHISYAVLISLISIYIIWENKERWPELLFWLSIFIFLEIYQHFAKYIPQRIFVILPIIEILTVIPLGLITISAVAMWLILIVNIDAIIDMKTKYSLIFSVFSFVTYISIYIMKLGIKDITSLIMIVFIAIVQYGIVMGMGFMAKNFYAQKNLYIDLLGKQKLQMLELEQLAIVKERNRMAGEIHDSVGHQLTTALVQLEAITMLMGDEDSKIKDRMIIVKDLNSTCVFY